MSTGFTHADRDRLIDAMTKGVKEANMGGRRIVFHSLKEQIDLYNLVTSELAAASAPVASSFPRAVQIVVDL